jgi:hypothetical protein
VKKENGLNGNGQTTKPKEAYVNVYVLSHTILLAHPWQYLGWMTLVTLLIKICISTVRVVQKDDGRDYLLWNWFEAFFDPDYCVATLVGTLELAIYPVLISLGAWQAIGGWLGIKTAAGWRWRDPKDRQGYTNFLFGNALVIFASFLLTRTVTLR